VRWNINCHHWADTTLLEKVSLISQPPPARPQYIHAPHFRWGAEWEALWYRTRSSCRQASLWASTCSYRERGSISWSARSRRFCWSTHPRAERKQGRWVPVPLVILWDRWRGWVRNTSFPNIFFSWPLPHRRWCGRSYLWCSRYPSDCGHLTIRFRSGS
jgi:hypothetical protein